MHELQPILDWVSQHVAWGYLVVFISAFADSLVLVGLIVPGIALLFSLGTLAGLGILDLTWTLFSAFLGAVTGDVLSFFLGRHYHEHLYDFKIFRQNKTWLHKAHLFFKQHGAKSIIIGRFIGPMRATLPTVAGMLEMPVKQFLLADVSSGVGWALVYVLPGALLGTSLQVIDETTGLAMLGLASLAFIGLGAWSSYYAWAWSKRFFVWLGDRFFPVLTDAPAAGTLFVLGFIFFVVTLWQLASGGVLVHLSQSLLAFLQSVEQPVLFHLAVGLTALGEDIALVFMACLMMIGLVHQKQYRVAGCVLGALITTVVMTTLLKYGLRVPRPSSASLTTAYSFPSGHTTHATVLWGYFFYLFNETIRNRVLRNSLYAFASMLIILIGLSRIYLEVHWLLDVIGGLTLGMMILSGFVLLQRYLVPNFAPCLTFKTKIGVLTTILAVLSIHQGLTHGNMVRWYQSIEVNPYKLIASEKKNQRYGLFGPTADTLNLYWRGPLTHLLEQLSQKGWTKLQWNVRSLPYFHQGFLSSAILTKQEQQTFSTLYLWKDRNVKNGEEIWIGLIKTNRHLH